MQLRGRCSSLPCPTKATTAAAAAAGAAAAAARRPRPSSKRLRASQREVVLYDYHDQIIDYEKAWQLQKQLVDQLCQRGQEGAAAGGSSSPGRDSMLLLQHAPVYTLGAGATEEHVLFDLAAPPHPTHRVERGGEVTYHGPGQLVMYPILDLTAHTQDLHWYLRCLEELVISALDQTSGLQGQRVQGLTGVWVGGAKLAAIGIRARKWVTYHGLALNVTADLEPFRAIVPCGIGDRPVGSVMTALAAAAATGGGGGGGGGGGEGGRRAQAGSEDQEAQQGQRGQQQGPLYSQDEVPHSSSTSSTSSAAGGSGAAATSLASHTAVSGQQQLLDEAEAQGLLLEYRYALLAAFEEVFGVTLVEPSETAKAAADQALGLHVGGGSSGSSSGEQGRGSLSRSGSSGR